MVTLGSAPPPLFPQHFGGRWIQVVLVGGTGTGKSHLAVGITRACIRNGTRARCYDVVELVDHLEAEARDGRQGRTAEQLCCCSI